MAAACMSVEALDTACRVCLSKGYLDIYDSTFDTDDGEIRIADAFDSFSCTQNDPDEIYLICYECTVQLISAYQFLIKLQTSEQVYRNERQQAAAAAAEEAKETMDVFYIEEVIDADPSEEINHIDIQRLDPPLEEMNDNEQIIQSNNTPSINNKPTYNTWLIKNDKKAKLDEPSATDLNRKRKMSVAPSSSTKKSSLSYNNRAIPRLGDAEFEGKNIMIPQFIIRAGAELATASEFCIPSSGVIQAADIKTLDVLPVRLTADDLHDMNLTDVAVNEDEHAANADAVYKCRYCPKAFSTAHHLIQHNRKSHLCQFCLGSFERFAELHQHVRDVHVLFRCPLCPKEFHSNSNLRSHLKRSHSIQLPAHISLITPELLVSDNNPINKK